MKNPLDYRFITETRTPLDPHYVRRSVQDVFTRTTPGHFHTRRLPRSAAHPMSSAGMQIEDIADMLGTNPSSAPQNQPADHRCHSVGAPSNTPSASSMLLTTA